MGMNKGNSKYKYLSDEMFSHTRRCSSCGFCRIKCPTLEFKSNESWGARGRMLIAMGLAKGTLNVSSAVKDRLYSCTLCKACEIACPALINITECMMGLRDSFYKDKIGLLDADQSLIKQFQQDGTPFGAPKSPQAILNRKNHDFQEIETLLFFGCTILNSYPHLGVSLLNIFQKTEIPFTVLEQEDCCAGFLKMLGARELYEEAKQRLGAKIEHKAVKTVVTHCPTCYTMLKDFGLNLEVRHFTQFLSDLIEDEQLKFNKYTEENTVVSFHDPCHLGRWSKEYEAPRAILRAIPGIELREMSPVGDTTQGDKSICCGGPVRLSFRDFRDFMAEQNIFRTDEVKSTTLLTACPTCFHNLSSAAFIAEKEVKDLVVLLDEVL